MRSKRKKGSEGPSMFPFLSVLFCLLGTLMFLGVGIASTGLERAADHVSFKVKHESGSSLSLKRPIFLICSGDTARSTEGAYVFTAAEEARVDRSRWRGTPFTDFLDALVAQDEAYPLFLVRPDGIDLYRQLRDILEDRNRDRSTLSVRIPEKPAAAHEIPRSLRWKYKYQDGRLSFTRVMSIEERNLLKSLFQRESSRSAIDRLYEASQSSTDWVDEGSDLVPSEWTIEIKQEPPDTPSGQATNQEVL